MNKFIATLLLVAIAVSSVTAFAPQAASRTVARTQTATPFGSAFEVPSVPTSTTALEALKVKVDPNKKTKNASGNSKMAAYGGSVVIAVLLPVAFLVWSAVSK